MYLKFLLCLTAITCITLPAHAERYSSGGEAFLVGAMQGLFLWFIVWLWKSIKKKRNKEKENMDKESIEVEDIKSNDDTFTKVRTPWEEYKMAKPDLAVVFESIPSFDLNKMSKEDISEIETTLIRMSRKFGCSTIELKEICLNNIMKQFSKEELTDVINNLAIRANEDGKKFSISPEYTMPFIIKEWIKQSLCIK